MDVYKLEKIKLSSKRKKKTQQQTKITDFIVVAGNEGNIAVCGIGYWTIDLAVFR